MQSKTCKTRIDIEPLLESLALTFIKKTESNKTRLIGIHRGGVWLASWLKQRLRLNLSAGAVDISFYRDDFSARGLQPMVRPSNIPFPVDNANIVLIDDVIMSGRTVRAAINEIFDYGRPNTIMLACLIDLGKHELPIRPDIYASRMQLKDNERIELTGPEPMELYKISQKEQINV